MEHFDVAIVGAGPVGLTAALLLADEHVRVVLIEAASRPSDLPRAISIADESFRTMSRLGIADTLKAESFLDTGARYFGLGDRLLASSKPLASRIGHPAKSQFDQPVLEQLLWNRAAAHGDIEFLTESRATTIAQDETSASIWVDTPTGPREISAEWLLGADGGRSLTREALGVQLVGATQQERWIVIDLCNVPGDHEPYAEFHGNGKRPYVYVPGLKGRLRLEYMLFPHEDEDTMTAPDRILELVRPFSPQATQADIRRAAVYVAHQRIAEHYRVGRAFLIGDAAHLMPPFSGQGLNAGIRDALNISWKLLEALRGSGTDRLLNTYQTERRSHGVKMITISRRTGAVVMATGPVLPRLRDVAFRIVSIVPAIHRYLSGMKFITPPDYRNGIAVRPRGVDARAATWVGLALSQPSVSTPDMTAPLDEFLGSGWVVLTVGGEQHATLPALDSYWAQIGARTLRLTGTAVSAAASGALVDEMRTLALDGLAAPLFIAVRPDRYVAAVFNLDSEAAVISELRAFVDTTSVQRERDGDGN